MNAVFLSIPAFLFVACASTNTDLTASAESEITGPQFYRVTGNGTSAYLFGTVHLNDERTKSFPAVEAAFTGSDSLFVEIAPGPEGRAEMRQSILLPEGTSLDQLLGDDLWRRAGDRYELAGQSRADLDGAKPMVPWLVMGELPFLESRATGKPVPDLEFKRRALADGKPVHKMETITQHLQLFTDTTLDDQVVWFGALLDKLDQYDDEGRNMTDETIEAWASGDPAKLFGLMDQILYPYMLDRKEKEAQLLWIRNERFAERLDRALHESPEEVAFVAVGAMHLPSPPGVDVDREASASAPRHLGLADLMRARGYQVTRIDAVTGVSAK
ncbi:TraB family protein [Planctomycetes bacterium Poly30]|uniref:TraB family protein n=1 Tax=Saltatorellus ferox TaxID=2528018 RepID=A0A518EZP9_9BACT|nr:TraB family protein [Planctomycetes bacterium Poly30]